MEDMDVSEDMDEILLLLEDNIFLRFNLFNNSIYGRLFDRGNRFTYGDPLSMNLPEIKTPPNTTKLLKTSFFQRVQSATRAGPSSTSTSSSAPSSLATIRRHRRPPQTSLVQLLQQRERHSWPSPTRTYVNNIFLPNCVRGALPTDDKIKYCSVYSPDNGRHLVLASIDGHVTVFNTEDPHNYRQVSCYFLDQNHFSPLDLDISPDGREFLVSTWRNHVFTCNVLEEDDINRNYMKSNTLVETASKMGTFSASFSNDGKEILASATDGCIYLYDRTRDERTERIQQDLREDINAARFLDRTNNNVIIGGSNQGIIEIWDRRCLGTSQKSRKSVATLFGHHDGITYIDPKGDGRYFISNSKDQSVKLWDVRKTGRKNQLKNVRKQLAQPLWNYLYDAIPTEFYGDMKPLEGDCSVMTYRGHRVAKTLIRAKFSPTETTGNRFIYTGCATGRVIVYDTLTGGMSRCIEGHSDAVRDVSWHPLRPEIATASFDEKVNLCVYTEKVEAMPAKPLRRSKRIAAKRARDSV